MVICSMPTKTLFFFANCESLFTESLLAGNLIAEACLCFLLTKDTAAREKKDSHLYGN